MLPVKVDLAIFSPVIIVCGFMLSYKWDFSSSIIMPYFGKSSHIYAAIPADSESSTSEQFKGLMTHMCLMIQFTKNLGGMV